ncbi:MAG TPA: hypothetical protein PKB15_01630 [Acidimicrobiia bacterium]|nr:hypothetical protein [Acidimicrobiia bacterium]
MPDIESVGERIEVMCVFADSGDMQQICVPRKIKHKGRTIEFTEFGFRHPTSQGNRMIHVFDMTDGLADYRIEFDAESLTWTLVSTMIVE